MQLLQHGFSVKGSVRSEGSKKRAAHLVALADSMGATLSLHCADLVNPGGSLVELFKVLCVCARPVVQGDAETPLHGCRTVPMSCTSRALSSSRLTTPRRTSCAPLALFPVLLRRRTEAALVRRWTQP